PHAGGGVTDGAAGGQTDGPADDIAAQHTQGFGLFDGEKPAADDNVGTLLQLGQHGFDVFRLVLAVGIQLHGTVVAVFGGIAQPRLEGAGQPQIDRQINEPEAVGPAEGGSLVTAAVV